MCSCVFSCRQMPEDNFDCCSSKAVHVAFQFFYNIICWHGRGTCVEVRVQLIGMGSLLPPWVLGLKPRSPGLAASTLTGAILPALIFFF